MRICVTCASDSLVIDEIYFYCQMNSIAMHPGRYLVVDDHYYTWRIECELNRAVSWMLLRWSDHLVVY
jgi:hypothetical protein